MQSFTARRRQIEKTNVKSLFYFFKIVFLYEPRVKHMFDGLLVFRVVIWMSFVEMDHMPKWLPIHLRSLDFLQKIKTYRQATDKGPGLVPARDPRVLRLGFP